MTKKKSKLFDSRILWAIASIVASLFIWVYITGTQEESIEKTFNNVEVQFIGEDTLQASRGYVINNISAETVSVKISGTRRNIGSLSASDVKATIDVSLISTTGTITQYYTLTFPDSVDPDAVSLVSSNPSVISFNVTRMSSKEVPVEVQWEGSTAEGYIAEDVEFEPSVVTISGPESELENIEYVYAVMGGDELTMTRTAEVPFVLMDKDDKELDSSGLEFDVDTISVTIPISMMKEVPLYVQCSYGAGATEENTFIKIEPSTITISGDTSVVSGTNRIRRRHHRPSRGFALTLPGHLRYRPPNDVENVTGITESQGRHRDQGVSTKTGSRPRTSSYTGLPDGYSVEEIITQSLEVKVRGTQEVLDQIQSSNIRVVADLSEISQTGIVMYVPVRVIVDGFTDAGAVGDYMIAIKIRS
ncbi:MAG: YbbR-like domain-containing protein [Lachnospiraceae bacterium]